MFVLAIALIFAVLIAAVAARARTASRTRGRLTGGWGDAWLKTLAIVIGITLLVILVPSMVLQFESVSGLDRNVQDLIGSGLWAVGLGGSLLALAWAHRKEYI